MSVMAQLEFELAHNNDAVLHISHYATGTPSLIEFRFLKIVIYKKNYGTIF